MKTRFIVILTSILLMPVISFAGVPSADVLNMPGNVGEVMQTTMSKIENSKQVLTIQKTMAKIGSAKASISDFVNKTKENVLNSEAVKQLQDYKKRITDGAAKLKAMKAEADKYVNMGKDAIDKGKEYVDKGKEYVEKGKEYVEKGKEALNTVKDLKEQGGIGDALKGAVGGIAGDAAGKMGIDVDKAKGLTDKAKGVVSKEKTELATEDGAKELTATASKADAGVVAVKADKDKAEKELAVSEAEYVDAKEKLKLAEVEQRAACKDPKSKACKEANDKLSAAKLQENVAKAKDDIAQKAKIQKDADLKQKAAIGPVNGEISKLADGAKLSDAPMVATARKAGGFTAAKPSEMLAQAAVAKTLDAVKAKAADTSAKEAQAKAAVAKTLDAVKAKAADASAKEAQAKAAVAKTLDAVKAKAADASAKEAQAKAAVAKTLDAVKAKAADASAKEAQAKAAVAKTLDAVKAKAADASAKEAQAKAAVAKTLDAVKAKANEKTKRQKFKSSFGYGKLQTSQQLSFAFLDSLGSVGGGDKTGETAEGVLIVPEPALLRCQQLSKDTLNYETAIKDKKMDACLRKINTLATSMVTEETSKKDIDDASKDMTNSYVEFLTATYFEALEIYNESLTFKNNKLSPVLTTSTSDVDGSWRVAKEMHLVLGDRINLLHKLWSRVLSMKMLSRYASEKFANKEE